MMKKLATLFMIIQSKLTLFAFKWEQKGFVKRKVALLLRWLNQGTINLVLRASGVQKKFDKIKNERRGLN